MCVFRKSCDLSILVPLQCFVFSLLSCVQPHLTHFTMPLFFLIRFSVRFLPLLLPHSCSLPTPIFSPLNSYWYFHYDLVLFCCSCKALLSLPCQLPSFFSLPDHEKTIFSFSKSSPLFTSQTPLFFISIIICLTCRSCSLGWFLLFMPPGDAQGPFTCTCAKCRCLLTGLQIFCISKPLLENIAMWTEGLIHYHVVRNN